MAVAGTSGPDSGRSVLLLSGGLDSAANLALACEAEEAPILALTADYGQQAAAREAESAKRLAAYYDIRHLTVDLRWLGSLGGNALTDRSVHLPKPALEKLDDPVLGRQSAQAVWVPNRNGVLIQAAAAYAEALGAGIVLVGFNIEEAQTFADNSQGFIDASNAALAFSTRNGVHVRSRTTQWDKARIVRELRNLSRPFPFELLWSCYKGDVRPCGECESCRRLQRAQGRPAEAQFDHPEGAVR